MYSPVFALARAGHTVACGQDLNPFNAKSGTPQWISRFLARDKGFEPLTFWSVARRSIQLS